MNDKNDNIETTKKHRIKNNQDGNRKNISSINICNNKKHNRNKWRNLCRSKISWWENRGSLKEHEQNIKTWSENSTGNADKKNMKTDKNRKTKEKHLHMLRTKLYQKVLAKERKLKNIPTKGKGHSKTTKENSPKLRKMMQTLTDNWMQRKLYNSGTEYSNQNITKKKQKKKTNE